MTWTLSYASARSDIWRWYWRTWRKKLWMTHVAVALVLGLALATSGGQSLAPDAWARSSLAVFPVVVIGFAAFPQLAFKLQVRVLAVGPDGWSTTIGQTSGSRRWSEVAAVEEDGEAVVIQGTNGNALIVPGRAFKSADDRRQFLADARRWHVEAGAA